MLGPHRQLAERLLAAGDAAAATDVITAMIEAWGGGIAGLDEWVAEVNQDAFQRHRVEPGRAAGRGVVEPELLPGAAGPMARPRRGLGDEAVNLDIVETAVDQWWDYPPLVAAMQGNITEQGAWERRGARLRRRADVGAAAHPGAPGADAEYIHLAEAEGQTSLYVNMLARSGQVTRAVAEARQWTQSPTEILSLAKVLVEQGERAAALDVAGHGLDMTGEGSKTELARWTVTLAQGADDPALALRAAQTAFTSSYELADYQVVERLAGADWPAVKAGLLEQMARPLPTTKSISTSMSTCWRKRWRSSIGSFYSSDLERVIQATRAEFPDWGIRKCQRQAEGIMNAGKAKDYDTAVAWVRTARDIYLQHDRGAEWQAYLDGLLEAHARKYKLVPMLRGIR